MLLNTPSGTGQLPQQPKMSLALLRAVAQIKIRPPQLRFPACAFTCCETSDKLLNHSMPDFSHLSTNLHLYIEAQNNRYGNLYWKYT